MKYSRQRTLVVAPIQQYIGDMGADSSLVLERGKWRVDILLKTLLSKFRYQNQLVSKTDLVYLNYLYGRFIHEQKLGLQRQFNAGEEFFSKKIIKICNELKDLNSWSNSSIELYDPWYMSKHAYFGVVNENSFKMPKLKMSRRPKRVHFQKFVGVGYNDKGTSRNTSEDASPRWQEAAVTTEVKRYLKDSFALNQRNDSFRVIKRQTSETMSGIEKFHLAESEICLKGSNDLLVSGTILVPQYGQPEKLAGFKTDHWTEEDICHILSVINRRLSRAEQFVPVYRRDRTAVQVIFLTRRLTQLVTTTIKL